MRRLHPATILVALLPRLREAVQAAVPLFIGLMASGKHNGGDWIAIFIGGFTGIFAVATYWTTRFDVEPDHMSVRTGWIFRNDKRIPIVQIQNVNLRQNVLERLFKVATVHVETAKGHGHDLKLSVLGIADAEKLRDELLGAAHLGGEPVQESHAPLLKLSGRDLVLGAVTENHISTSLVGLATVSGPAIGYAATLAAKMSISASLLVMGGAAVLVVGGWMWGAVNYILKYGEFTVRRDDNALRITYGLLNKIQMAIRPNRIEYIHLTATLPQRWMHRANLSVGTASSFGEAGVHAPVALFVATDTAYHGVTGVIPGLRIDRLKWQPFAPIFYWASLAKTFWMIVILGACAWYLSLVVPDESVHVVWNVFVAVAGLLAFAKIPFFLSRAVNGFAITDDAVVVRRGYFTQSIAIMPIGRMENMAVTQPFWWKKWQASRFGVQAMKHWLHIGAISDEGLESIIEHWKQKIEEREHAPAMQATESLSLDLVSALSGQPEAMVESPQAG